MRTTDELTAAWKDVTSLPLETQNDDRPLGPEAIRACVEATSEWLRDQADGNGASTPAFRLETSAMGWSPGPHLAAYRALLPELVLLDKDQEVAYPLVNEIGDKLIRDMVAAEYIGALADRGLIERAHTARNFLKFAHPQMRCKAVLAIASASRKPHDLFVARASADRLEPRDKVPAYLDIYRSINDPEDLFMARNTAKRLEPHDKLIAFEHISLATDCPDDYLAALEAAKAVGFHAVVRTLAQITAAFSPLEKNPMSRETLIAIVNSPKLDAFPDWKNDMIRLIEASN